MKSARALTLRLAADGKMRLAVFHNVEHVVVPVVALVEGVIQASNAETPELILSSEFSRSLSSWNGRPVMLDHPMISGEPVSANIPSVLESSQLGVIFGTRSEDRKLKMEAWLNPNMVKAAKSDIIERVAQRKTVDVSVGVLVDTEATTGEYNGTQYGAVWRNIVPDHLAMLSEGTPGACSIEMGCGAPRAASQNADTSKGDEMKLKVGDKIRALIAKWNEPRTLMDDGLSDNDVRHSISNALYSTVPAFLAVMNIYPESNAVVYCSAPDGEEKYYRRTYSLGEDGTATLNDDAVEVLRVEEFKPVTEGKETPVVTTASSTTHGAGICACKKEDAMDKKVLIAKILAAKGSQFTAEDSTYLETLSEARLTALSAQAETVVTPPAAPAAPVVPPVVPPVTEKPEEMTEDRVLAMFPHIGAMVNDYKSREASRRKELIIAMKPSVDSKIYTEAELTGMTLDTLEKLVKVAGVKTSNVSNIRDFSGLGTPREAQTNEEEIPEPQSLHGSVRTARGIK